MTQRRIVTYLSLKGMLAREIHDDIIATLEPDAVSYHHVRQESIDLLSPICPILMYDLIPVEYKMKWNTANNFDYLSEKLSDRVFSNCKPDIFHWNSPT
jgi:hypothetical protein